MPPERKSAFKQELFNHYRVHFKEMQPVDIWAKQYNLEIRDGFVVHNFYDPHSSSYIETIIHPDVLYVEIVRFSVALETL